jgi:hypothetical protein
VAAQLALLAHARHVVARIADGAQVPRPGGVLLVGVLKLLHVFKSAPPPT